MPATKRIISKKSVTPKSRLPRPPRLGRRTEPEDATLDHVGRFKLSDEAPVADDAEMAASILGGVLEALSICHARGCRAHVLSYDADGGYTIEIVGSVRDFIVACRPLGGDDDDITVGSVIAAATGRPFEHSEWLAWEFQASELQAQLRREERRKKSAARPRKAK